MNNTKIRLIITYSAGLMGFFAAWSGVFSHHDMIFTHKGVSFVSQSEYSSIFNKYFQSIFSDAIDFIAVFYDNLLNN